MELEELFKAYELLRSSGFTIQKENNVSTHNLVVGEKVLEKD